PLIMEVHPSVPVKTVAEFIAYAKARPGKINMGSGGIGTTLHVSGELFKMMTGVDMLHVPYRGAGPMLTDLLGGQVQLAFDPMPSSMGAAKAGKWGPRAATTATRSEALRELPSVGDAVAGYEASTWYGAGAPKNPPAEVIDRLNKEINAGLADPKLKTRLTELGGMMLTGSSADFGTFIADETQKWARWVIFSRAKPD